MHDSNEEQVKLPALQNMSRRSFVKGAAGAGLVVASLSAADSVAAREPGGALKGKKLAMVIDLQRCTGCGGCFIACKSENNVQQGNKWTWPISETTGTFPNVGIDFLPALCNHCENAPCVRVCPTGAMHKGDGDITMHTPEKCIGCRSCIAMCPYGAISRNSGETHSFWRGEEAVIEGCTAAPVEVARQVKGNVIPHYNADKEKSSPQAGLRIKGIAEKCTFCDHRTREGELPFCVVSCPANARIVGDLNDPNSEVSKLIIKYRPMRLKEHLGTEPKVYYIRSFNPSNYRSTKGSV
jgi:Fe-S-cluster-containing dehydrogenase component